jgi:glutamate dehydrogenase/leucine dehydrogenase
MFLKKLILNGGKNMNRIKARMIIPGSNVPLTKEAEEFLHQKGITMKIKILK